MSNIYMFFMKLLRNMRKKYKLRKYNKDMSNLYLRYRTNNKPRYFHRYEPDDFVFVYHKK